MKRVTKYQAVIIILSLVVVVMTLLQLTLTLTLSVNHLFNGLDRLIWLFFFVDYLVRLSRSESKREFIFKNKLDLLVIIPFYSFYRLFRLIRITEVIPLLKFTKILRVTVMLGKISKQVGRFIRTNNLNYVLLYTITIVLLGAGGLTLTEGMDLKDALWWSIVTVTTVGYGDIVPQTGGGRIIATLVMLSGIGFLGALTGTISTYFLNRREETYRPKIVEEMVEKLEHFDELSLEEFQQIVSVLELIKKGQTSSIEPIYSENHSSEEKI